MNIIHGRMAFSYACTCITLSIASSVPVVQVDIQELLLSLTYSLTMGKQFDYQGRFYTLKSPARCKEEGIPYNLPDGVQGHMVIVTSRLGQDNMLMIATVRIQPMHS